MIENSDTFDWYEFYEMGCLLLKKGDEKSLRTAINRFYYASFCRARDYLIKNNIYHNEDLNDKLHSDKSIVHSATRDLFKYATEFRNSGTGRTIHDKLLELRDYRNSVDYDSNKINNLIFYARRSEVDSKKLFNLIQDLEQINI